MADTLRAGLRTQIIAKLVVHETFRQSGLDEVDMDLSMAKSTRF